MQRQFTLFALLFLFFSELSYGALNIVILNSHLTGELNSLVAIAKGLGGTYQVVESEQLDLLNENPDLILHALGNPEEIEELRQFKAANPRVKLVNLSDPMNYHSIFDAIIYSSHIDKTHHPHNIVVEGVPSPITVEETNNEKTNELWIDIFKKMKSKKIAVLIGGNAKGSTFTSRHAELLAKNLKQLRAKYNASLVITDSRRTSDEARDAFLSNIELDSTDKFFGWEHAVSGRNPYKAILGNADYVVVTGDSMSMIADSIKLGKPTYIFAPEGSLEKRHKLFIIQQAKQGRVKALSSNLIDYSYKPLDTTQSIVKSLRIRLGLPAPISCKAL